MAYNKPTIAQEGGLKVHVEKLGGRWDIFQEYWNDPTVKHTQLGRLMARDKNRPFNGRTIKGWRNYYSKNGL